MSRPKLLLLAAPFACREKSTAAATLAWLAERHDWLFDVYYGANHDGTHYGGGLKAAAALMQGGPELSSLTGGLVAGGRHLEALAAVLHRFDTTVVFWGASMLEATLDALGEGAARAVRVAAHDGVGQLYGQMFDLVGEPWPEVAVLVEAAPTPELPGIDAYLWPEIFHRRAVGVEASTSLEALQALRERGVRRLLSWGANDECQARTREVGFDVEDVGVPLTGADYASVTAALAGKWARQHRGWLLGDPVLAAYWLPVACRQRRTSIYGEPQSRLLELLGEQLKDGEERAVLGRQYADGDFFELSRRGLSFQLVDPGRPPFPVAMSAPGPNHRPADPTGAEAASHRPVEPTDHELETYARDGRVLVSLLFWTGMLRESENLYALADLVAMTGLKAGLLMTVPALGLRMPPLDLLSVPRDEGGVWPDLEVLLASCGTGGAIESLVGPERLAQHLETARGELARLGLAPGLSPEGWWAVMDAPLEALPWWRKPRPLQIGHPAPYGFHIRYHPRPPGSEVARESSGSRRSPRERMGMLVRDRLRSSRLRVLFNPYRPYEDRGPGALEPAIAETVRAAGFSYMFSKSGFGRPPHILYRAGDFVALNHTAGRWDGWTPFETLNGVHDLRAAEKRLLRKRRPGWLVGTIDACLWAMSGEFWRGGRTLLEMARFAASGGDSADLVNVTPRVVARYARIIQSLPGGGADNLRREQRQS